MGYPRPLILFHYSQYWQSVSYIYLSDGDNGGILAPSLVIASPSLLVILREQSDRRISSCRQMEILRLRLRMTQQ